MFVYSVIMMNIINILDIHIYIFELNVSIESNIVEVISMNIIEYLEFKL